MSDMNVKIFLFGGETQFKVYDGFNSFGEYKKESLKDYKTFRDTVEILLSEHGWDSKEGVSVDREEADVTFSMPNDAVLASWYEELKEEV